MRLATFAFLVLAGTSVAAAQAGQQPTIALTIGGGVVTGHELWTIDKQPLCLLNTNGTCSNNYDTLRLSRSISSSLVIGASGTYFPWQHVGFHAEISYVGFPTEDACNGAGIVFPDPPDERHQQMCDNLASATGTGGAISIFVGVTARAASRRAISPYVRGNVGLVSLSRSMVEVVGAYVDATGPHERQIIADENPKSRAPMFGLAAGFTSPIGTGYQFRLEARDMIASLERITGPANDLAVAPTATRYYHHFALILGFDVILEKKRGRRY
jgi:hypothetical protein